MFLGDGKKPENWEETDMDVERTCETDRSRKQTEAPRSGSKHGPRRCGPGTSVLLTVPPCHPYSTFNGMELIIQVFKKNRWLQPQQSAL